MAYVEPGHPVLMEVYWTSARVRACYLGGDDLLSFESSTGVIFGCTVNDVRRFRLLQNLFMVDDFVLLRDVDSSDWRGVVIEVDGDDLTVLSSRSEIEFLHADELVLASSVHEQLPPVKRGPISADPVAETLGQERVNSFWKGEGAFDSDYKEYLA